MPREDLLLVDLFEPIKGEWWARTVAQPPLQPSDEGNSEIEIHAARSRASPRRRGAISGTRALGDDRVHVVQLQPRPLQALGYHAEQPQGERQAERRVVLERG